MYVGFEFRVIWHDNDVLNLCVSAWNGQFGGVAEVYEAIGALRDAASRLRGFPKDPEDNRELVFGNFDRNCAAGGIKMRFHCVDGAGHAFVEATIDSNCYSGGTIEIATLAVPVEAAAVDTFVEELERLDATRSGVACLQAKEISW